MTYASRIISKTLTLSWLLALLAGCSNDDGSGGHPIKALDFSEVDSILENFVADDESFDGGSIVVIEKTQGIVHLSTFGTHTEETIVQLASTSKVPSSLILLAISEDESIDFDMEEPIENYYEGTPAYPGVTTEQALSNTSGIPGLMNAFLYPQEFFAHGCQYLDIAIFDTCNQHLFETRLDIPTPEPGTFFDYGGGQWQLAGGVAERVTGKGWNQLVTEILVEPCDLEVFEYGNMFTKVAAWDGTVESLLGRNNPSLEGGAITNIHDYAKLLLMQINGGKCGENQIISPEGLAYMRIDRGSMVGSGDFGVETAGDATNQGYGLGWWIDPVEEGEEQHICCPLILPRDSAPKNI